MDNGRRRARSRRPTFRSDRITISGNFLSVESGMLVHRAPSMGNGPRNLPRAAVQRPQMRGLVFGGGFGGCIRVTSSGPGQRGDLDAAETGLWFQTSRH